MIIIMIIRIFSNFRFQFYGFMNLNFRSSDFQISNIFFQKYFKFFSKTLSHQYATEFNIVWCPTKFMLTTNTDFDTAQVMDKNSSMDIVSDW